MKALVLEEYNRFEYKDVEEPTVGPEDVLIAVKACGICGSDVHGMDGSTGRRKPPVIMGHEAAGVITALGDKVTDWNIGDRVTFDSTVYCGACPFCIQKQVNLCDDRQVLGVSCDDYRRHGALAEYVSVPRHILYALPDEASFEHASIVEPLSVAAHAVDRTRDIKGNTALVVGTGVIGLLIVQVLRASGFTRVIAADLDEDKLQLAKQMGAEVALKSDDCDVLAEVLKLTDGQGVDAAFEAVGIRETVNTAIASVRKGGAVALVGNVSHTVELMLQTVVTKELTIYGSCASAGDYPDCLNMIARGDVNPDSLISATAPLSEGAKWFDRLHKKEPGLFKVILRP